MKKIDNNGFATGCPLGNAVRLQYLDEAGDTYFTEYQLFDPAKSLAAQGRTVAVAGIHRHGIGEAITARFLAQGDSVVACDKNRAAGLEATAHLRRSGADLSFVEADVSTEQGATRFMEGIARQSGRLDTLVCNIGCAGNPADDNILDLTPERIHGLINDNLLAPVLLTQAALRRFFLPQGCGAVIYIGTNNCQRSMGVRGQMLYGASKCALSAVLAACVAQVGHVVRFNLIRPGVVETDSDNWRRRRQENPNWSRLESSSVPARVLGAPADVANAVVWLASDEARYVNGAELAVDGGERASGIMFPAWDPVNFRQSYVAALQRFDAGVGLKAA